MVPVYPRPRDNEAVPRTELEPPACKTPTVEISGPLPKAKFKYSSTSIIYKHYRGL